MNNLRRHRIRRVLLLISLACLLGVVAPYVAGTTTGGAFAATATIAIHDGAFSPTSFSPNPITVTQGDTITWLNNGPSQHTTTSDPGQADSWDSGLAPPLSVGQTFQHTFNVLGTFTYHCAIHLTMTGSVNVVAPATNTPVPAATNTPIPAATNTPIPAATNTSTLPPTTAPTAFASVAVPPTTTTRPASPVSAASTNAPATGGTPSARAAAMPRTGTGDSRNRSIIWWIVIAVATVGVLTSVGALALRDMARSTRHR
jgi:plastocyanin